MKAYVLSIAGMILLCAIISLVLPSGKMGKALGGFLKISCFSVMIAPFLSMVSGEGVSLTTSSVQMDESYLKRCEQLAEKAVVEEVVTNTYKEFSVVIEPIVDCDEVSPFSVKKIVINEVDFGIIEDDKHIDIVKKIVSRLRDKYACEVVMDEFS